MNEQKKSKKKMSTAKKVVLGLFGVALIVGATIAGTMAFLRTTTGDPKENVFTSSKDIVLGLDEPSWNWVDANGLETAHPKHPDKPNPGNFQPGITYDKDPFLANLTGKDATTGELAEEWVAMRVDYLIDGTAVTYTNLTTDNKAEGYTSGKAGIIGTITPDSNWYQIPNALVNTINNETAKYDIYIYKYKLKADQNIDDMGDISTVTGSTSGTATATTSKLFSSITIKSQDRLIANGWEDGRGELVLPTKFSIKVKGAAIKHDSGITATEIDTGKISASPSDDDKKTDSYKIAEELVKLLKVTP